MGPESLVDDVEESAAVELVVFDCTQVPHLGLYHRLTHPIGLWNITELIGKVLLASATKCESFIGCVVLRLF